MLTLLTVHHVNSIYSLLLNMNIGMGGPYSSWQINERNALYIKELDSFLG